MAAESSLDGWTHAGRTVLCPTERSGDSSQAAAWCVLQGEDPPIERLTVPHVNCPTCRLTSYVVPPHAARPQCPHCDADLLPAVVRPAPVVRPEDDQLSAGAA